MNYRTARAAHRARAAELRERKRLRKARGARDAETRARRALETWTMVGPFRATDKRSPHPLPPLNQGWEILDSQGRLAETAPSRDKARARAREMTADGVTITRRVPA